jgi:hypothetical protein
MGRPRGSKNRLTDNGKSEKLAPADCPYRAKKTRMYQWFCLSLCKEYPSCEVWGDKSVLSIPVS